MAPQAPFKKAEQLITLPPSSFLRIHDYEEEVLTIYQDIVPQVSVLEVHFGSVSEFEFFYPLVPISISGQGVAIIDGVEYTIGSAALSERFSDRENPIYSIAVTTIGDKNAISYLLNPVRFSLDGVMDVDVVSGEETLSVLISGDAGNDVLIGAGGADTLIGGQGDDRLTQTAVTLNDAAGSRLKGGSGDDRLVFEGSQAYTSNYVTLLGDEGADVISAGVLQSQYVGAMQVDGGSGDDLIEVGHIEGSTGGRGYLAGGEDNDVLRVLDTWNGIGIWGNSTFKLMGDAGDDRFDLAGRQLNIVGNDQGAQLDGGAGFDSLAWNGRYNLTINGHQNPSLGLYAGYKQELKVSNVENVDLVAGGATGLTVKFTELDVMTITAGSDFDRSTLGLGLSGTGNTLFVNAASNEVDVTGLVNLGGAFVNGQEYGLYQVGGAYLGVLTDMTLSGTPVGETLRGYGGNDILIGAGGADTLIGGQGDDRLTQTAVTLNDAAGSRLKGGSGDDRLVFEGSQAYTSNYVTLLGDEGADVISAGVLQSQYVGAMQVDGGSGDDLIEVGHIEGSTGGRGYLAGGEDNDVLRVLDTWNGIGIWGNSTFKLMGDAGDDRFDLAGRQLNIVGNDQGAQLDGGAGFDSLAWNGRYNLTINGHQNPSLGLYAGYKQELKVSNVENVDLVAGGATGLTVKFTELDVMTITAGSDFDRSTLGLGLSGTGNTLFVNAASNEVDVTGLVNLGGAFVNGQEYGLYQVGGAYLGVLTDMTLSGTPVGETLRGYGGNDILIGAGGADTLIGGQGDDRLQGEEGADILFGGEGVDRLEGGAGSDLFVFFSVTDSCLVGHYDAILDFISGYDLIDLSGIDANDTTLGNQAFDFVSTADFSGAAGELRFDSNYGLLSGDTNGDSFSDFGISLAGRTSLASSDILL